MHVNETCSLRPIKHLTPQPCGSHWITCGGKTMALYRSCLVETPLRKKEVENNTHAHTQTAICHGCRQPGHHLPLQMGQNTQNNRLREKKRDEQGTTAWGADINQWLSFCLHLSRSLYTVAHSSQMGQSFKVLLVHQLLNVITCVPAGEEGGACF